MASRPGRFASSFLGHHKNGKEEGFLTDWEAIVLTGEPLVGGTHILSYHRYEETAEEGKTDNYASQTDLILS